MNQITRLTENFSAFRSKHYRQAIGLGVLTTASVALGCWLIFAVAEHLVHFSETVRLAMLLAYSTLVISLLIAKIIRPALSWMGALSPMRVEDAARLISGAIGTLDDQLLNVLSLQHKVEGTDNTLLLASLEQKAAAVNHFDFSTAVDGRRLFRALRYLLLPILVFIGVMLWNPSLVMDATGRIVAYNESFIPPAPFQFNLPSGPVQVAAGEPFELEITTTGNQLPAQLFLLMDGSKVRMKKMGAGQFAHTFSALNNDLILQLTGAGYYSEKLHIEVIPKPKIVRYTAQIEYPKHTGRRSETIMNQPQVQVPEGSIIRWKFDLADADEVMLVEGKNELQFENGGHHLITPALRDTTFHLALSHHKGLQDTQQLSILAQLDGRPKIQVEEFTDSTRESSHFFSGVISDDYGFTRLVFHCYRSNDGKKETLTKTSLGIAKDNTEQRISHVFQSDSLGLSPGDQVHYYFEVWDNDGIRGAKSARSREWTLKVPTLEELKQSESAQATATKSSLDEKQRELQGINKDLEALKKELLNKKQPDWQDKERLKSLLEKQKQAMEQLKQQLDAQRSKEELRNKLQPYSEELLEKQERIQELFDELFDEEYKEKYDEYMKLLDEMNKQEMMDKLDNMQMDNETLEKEMDRTLELFKQLEFEKSLEDAITQIDELTREQRELQEKTESKSMEAAELKKEQEQLKDKLNEAKEALETLEEQGQSLEEKVDVPDVSAEQDAAEGAMDNASEALGNNKEKKAGEQQGEAGDQLQKMSDKLSDFQQEQAQSQSSENLDDMRQILENLVDLSHDQEDIIAQLKITRANDPKYVQLAQAQKKAMDDVRVVEDSILALSKRVPQLSNQLNEEINWVKMNMERGLSNMTNQPPNQSAQYIQKAMVNQQLAMTSLNNLAVLFDGIIENMQQQMQSEMKGDGQCNKPGSGKGGKPSVAQMKQAQKNLNEQIKKLKEALEKGKSPGGQKPGQQQGMGMPGMSKELARMAAEQSAIRERLRELSNSIEQRGGKPGEGMKELEEMMEQTEEDLLYQNITRETLMRQEKIMTRLLESEKAEREREKDEKRESKPPSRQHELPSTIEQKYLQDKKNELELFKTLPPNLKPYYRKRVNRYFSELSN